MQDSWLDTVKTVLFAILIALFVRSVAYEPFNIPSGSMKPTLLIGDYLFVSKFSYGYSKYSLPLSLPIIPGRVMFSEPERGDVVVFKLPTDNKTDYIKRIVGLPGDTIQLRNSILYINGKPSKRERIEDFVQDISPNRIQRVAQFRETLPNGVEHNILEYTENMPEMNSLSDNTPVYTVPEGHYFGMGDNRDRSQDSRYLSRVGFIPKKNLVGRAEFLFFSIDGQAWKLWSWFSKMRPQRVLTAIK